MRIKLPLDFSAERAQDAAITSRSQTRRRWWLRVACAPACIARSAVMPLSAFELLAPDEYEQALRLIARRDALADYDRGLIRDSREAIRRSRELLEATKHQVRPSSKGA